MDKITLPMRRPPGRISREKEGEYWESLREFADGLRQLQMNLDFQMSARGWCYHLEGDSGLTKGDFDWAQKEIQKAREAGYLPPGFIADEDSRKMAVPRDLSETPEEFIEWHHDQWKEAEETFRNSWENYEWVSFWEQQDVYLQLFVEKVDLKSLFQKLCFKYRIPSANLKGHGSLEQKASAARNFKEMEQSGKQPVLLVCADFDPAGLCISQNQHEHFQRLAEFTEWDPSNLIVDRFGLNYEFIIENGLTWIEGLEGGSGKDISDPSHAFWKKNTYGVREYVAQYGRRKVEANSVVVKPEMGRQMLLDAIHKWLGPDAYEKHEEKVREGQERARLLIDEYLENDDSP